MAIGFRSFFKALVRRKYITQTDVTKTRLERCLTTFDLTFLGVGSTLGLGIYVLSGQVASTKAGPAVTVSFFIAALASVFSALCYAEFGARVPRAGSAYVYSYVTVGEFIAFIIGWNLVLEYVIGTASVARGYSGYLDFLVNGTIETHFRRYMPINLPGLSGYPDFLALGITLLLTVMLAVGVKESTRFNNIFTGLNLLVVLYAVIVGSFKADLHNWRLSPEEIPADAGHGGFFAYGFSGVMAGSAMCFYGYVGFDCIATTGEEAKNPQKAIPRSIVFSLSIVFLAYFGISSIQTLVWPYYDQNQTAPLPYVFGRVGWPFARWTIAIGALAGLSTSLLGGMFPLPRVLYAMANDGLIFRWLANVHEKFKTPFWATLIAGAFSGIMAMMFDVHELASMMSIGTLLAYTLVAVSVLLLRYRILDERLHLSTMIPQSSMIPSTSSEVIHNNTEKSAVQESEIDPPVNAPILSSDTMSQSRTMDLPNQSYSVSINTMLSSTHHYSARDILRMVFNLDNLNIQTLVTSQISIYLIFINCFLIFLLNLCLITLQVQLFHLNIAALSAVCIIFIAVFIMTLALYCQPSEDRELLFRVPCVPAIPILSIFINIYLMMNLSVATWIRFIVWMIVGFLIYFGYGINNSNERTRPSPFMPRIFESDPDIEEEPKTESSPLLQRRQ